MRAANDRRIQGFTLLELMIVVSIIGVLASVAIPSFLNYQLTSKRAEAFANLGALAKTQKSYFAEFNQFVAVAPEPGSTLGNVPDGTKRDVTSVRTGFSVIGFTPDGDVYFDYDTITGGVAGCLCQTCFTAAAYGNLDEDAFMSEVVYFHPDPSGGWCGVAVTGKGPPTDPNSGQIQWDTVVRHPSSDFF